MAKANLAEQVLGARFEVRSRLGEGGMGIVYEVFDRETSAPMAAKTLRKMAPEHLYWIKNEFRKLADVQHKNLIQLGELFYDSQQCFFTMELVRGENFRAYVRSGEQVVAPAAAINDADTATMSQLSPDSYFTRVDHDVPSLSVVATPGKRSQARFDEGKLRSSLQQLAEAISALHQRGLVHRDLKPSNVLVEPNGRLVVLDFGLADTLRRSDNDNAEGVYGTAAYMAPEQARKAAATEAADWYAFGVMLFNALTGRLPFEGPSQVILKAKQEVDAPRASAFVEDCPLDLDMLCSALLARDPGERPNAQEVLEQLSRAHSGKAARSVTRAENVFVGRSAELTQLGETLERTRTGKFEAVLVEGPPGVGKTELIEHFFASMRSGATPLIVLRGRCYEQEFVPFKGIDALVDALTRHLKSLPEVAVSALLPPRLNLVTALFPVLYRVPAVAAAVPPLAVNESKLEQRADAFEQLAQLFSAVSHTGRLVLFIDDLQWASADSFELLRALFERGDAAPCLLIATCRTTDRWERESSEVEAKEVHARVDPAVVRLFVRMPIAPLTSEEATRLMRHLWTRGEEPADEQRFMQLLDEARGHPLFLQELARYASSEQELPRELRLDQVLRERIGKLDPGARKLLEVSAIAGVPLPARVLARVASMSRVDSVAALRLLRSEQLVRTDSGTSSHSVEPYHDRVREAVVEGIKSGSYVSALGMDLPATHLELAHQLIRARSEDGLAVAATTLANHVNQGASALASNEQKREAAQLNLEAARQVKLASAYDAALHYLGSAREHLSSLSERGTLERDIDLMEMELAYLGKDEERGLRLFDKLVSQSKDDLERARAYETRIMVETAKNQLDRAIRTAREGLSRMGLDFPEKGKDVLLLADIASFELRLIGKKPERLLDLPVTDDARVRAQMQILMAMTPAAYFSDPVLMSIAMVRMAKISLLRGLSELSAYGFIGYALVLSGGFQNYQRAFKFSTLARKLNERFQNRALDAKIEHLHAFNCGPYVMSFDECRPGLKRVQELGLKNGDLNFRTYGAICTPMITLTAGEPLEQMRSECKEGVRVAEQEGNVDMAGQTQWRLRAIRCLAGENTDPLRMDAPGSSEEEFLREVEHASLPTALFAYGLLQAVLGVHFDQPRLALAGAERALKYAHAQFGLVTNIDLALYQTLAACKVVEQGVSPSEQRTLLKLAKKNVQKLDKWAKAHAQNFSTHALLAHAELSRITESPEKAEKALKLAIETAERFERHNLAALAHERMYSLKQRHGAVKERELELGRAIAAHRRWGANARVTQLEKRLAARTGGIGSA